MIDHVDPIYACRVARASLEVENRAKVLRRFGMDAGGQRRGSPWREPWALADLQASLGWDRSGVGLLDLLRRLAADGLLVEGIDGTWTAGTGAVPPPTRATTSNGAADRSDDRAVNGSVGLSEKKAVGGQPAADVTERPPHPSPVSPPVLAPPPARTTGVLTGVERGATRNLYHPRGSPMTQLETVRRAVCSEPGLTAREIGERIRLDPKRVSATLCALRDRGMVRSQGHMGMLEWYPDQEPTEDPIVGVVREHPGSLAADIAERLGRVNQSMATPLSRVRCGPPRRGDRAARPRRRARRGWLVMLTADQQRTIMAATRREIDKAFAIAVTDMGRPLTARDRLQIVAMLTERHDVQGAELTAALAEAVDAAEAEVTRG